MSSPPAQVEQTQLSFRIEASSGLNPDQQGRAAPVLVRVYELRSHNLFQEADFFALYNADRTTLGTDVLAVDQVIMRPGQTHKIRRKSHPETRAIGVLAGYRDLPRATWRAVYPMPLAPEVKWYRSWLPNPNLSLQIDLLSDTVRITDLLRSKTSVPPHDPRAATDIVRDTVPIELPTPEMPAVKTPAAPVTRESGLPATHP